MPQRSLPILGAIVASCLVAFVVSWVIGQVPAKYYEVLVDPHKVGGMNPYVAKELLKAYGEPARDGIRVGAWWTAGASGILMLFWLFSTLRLPSDPMAANERVRWWALFLIFSVLAGGAACGLALLTEASFLWPIANYSISAVAAVLGCLIIYILVGTLIFTPRELRHVMPARGVDFLLLMRIIRREPKREKQS